MLFDAVDLSICQSMSEDKTEVQTISQLFEGRSESYVKCRACGFESKREDTFLDLTLPIRNEFGTGVLNSSIEMALENYIKPELLNGGNQYFCE